MAKIKDSVPEMEYFEKIDTYIYSYKVGKGYIVVDYSGCENDVEHHYYKGSYWNPPEDYSELKTEEHIVNEYYLTEEDYNNVKISTREEFMKALDLSEADMKDIMYFVDGDSYEKFIEEWEKDQRYKYYYEDSMEVNDTDYDLGDGNK